MKSDRRGPARAWLLGLGLIVSASATAGADEVLLIPGSTVKAPGGRVRGQVESESPGEVVVRLNSGGQTQTVPAEEVASIRYDGRPPSMTLAESRESAGAIAEAAELYKKSAAEAASAGKTLAARDAQFRHAMAVAELGGSDPARAAEAIALLEAFAKAHPKGRQIGPALEALARLQLEKGDFPGAERTIALMAPLPRGASRAAVVRARLLGRKGDHAGALAELDKVLAASAKDKDPARSLGVKLARAESLAGMKKFPEAEADLRAVIDAAGAEDSATKSVAYNTLGDCLRAAGKPKDALLAYLHTDILYAKDKSQHARALAQIAQLWRQLQDVERANEVVERLKQEYPSSPWLTAAQSGNP